MMLSTAERLIPFEFQPGRLWSLWEMLERHVFFFNNALGAFTEFKYLCAEIAKEGQELPLTPNLRQLANAALYTLRQAYILSDLTDHMGALERLQRSVNPEVGHPEMPAGTIAQEVKHLIAGTRDLLESQYYFHVDGYDVPSYVTPNVFGPAVAQKFERANEDIAEAGKCVALQRPTACVFHLMRALEVAVQAFGKKLKVEINIKTETWHQIMLHVNKQIEKLQSKTSMQKKKKAAYAEAAAHLQSVRLAWRNEVMHPKQTYTRQEAFEIFAASRVFMDHLARIL